MKSVFLERIGLYAPGMIGWEEAQKVLSGDEPYEYAPVPRYKPALLPGNERRRATNAVRMAFGACEDAIGDRLEEAGQLASVFVSSGGDYGVHDQICRSLLQSPVLLSPTHFHNSVHNAPAGYWSIASASSAPSVSLSAFDYSVSAGLLEAVPMVTQQEQSLLLVISDVATDPPIASKRCVRDSFAVAFWLTPQPSSGSIAEFFLTLQPELAAAATCKNPAFDALQQHNPAARVLPVLEAIACSDSGRFAFPTASGQSAVLALQPHD